MFKNHWLQALSNRWLGAPTAARGIPALPRPNVLRRKPTPVASISQARLLFESMNQRTQHINAALERFQARKALIAEGGNRK